MRLLSPAETQQLVDAINPRFRALVLTGARFGELAALRVDDFNSEDRHIQIVRSLSGGRQTPPLR